MPVRRRISAGLALGAVPAMIAVAVVALLGDRSGLIVALILVAVAAAAAWLAVTERGCCGGSASPP